MDIYAFWHPKHENVWFCATTVDDAQMQAIQWQGYDDLSEWCESWVVVGRDGLYTDNELKYLCDTRDYITRYLRQQGYKPYEAARRLGIGTTTQPL